jgi:rhodanese-related sulfurtransferase
MRPFVLAAAAILVCTTVTTAQYLPPKKSNPLPVPTVQSDPAITHAPRITREDAIKMVREGKAVYVDVRSKATYDKGHIKGALSVPNSQLLGRIRELPAGKMIITYCACVKEHTAAVAVVNLANAGRRDAAALKGGWDEWKALGLPIEVTKERT